MKKIFYLLFSLIFLLKVEAQKKKNGIIYNEHPYIAAAKEFNSAFINGNKEEITSLVAEDVKLWNSMSTNKKQKAVGLEINANHVRPVSSGFVTGTTTVASLGRSVHVWNIDIRNDQGKLNCVSRLTTAIVDLKGDEIERNTKLLDILLLS